MSGFRYGWQPKKFESHEDMWEWVSQPFQYLALCIGILTWILWGV
jgi:hypothetical protein